MKKTVIIGASPNPARYAFEAANMLKNYGHEFVPLSIKRGEVLGKEILDIRTKPWVAEVHTITVYVRAELQSDFFEYFVALNPKRVIFNPGTENELLAKQLEAHGIEVEFSCTLVMLRTGQY